MHERLGSDKGMNSPARMVLCILIASTLGIACAHVVKRDVLPSEAFSFDGVIVRAPAAPGWTLTEDREPDWLRARWASMHRVVLSQNDDHGAWQADILVDQVLVPPDSSGPLCPAESPHWIDLLCKGYPVAGFHVLESRCDPAPRFGARAVRRSARCGVVKGELAGRRVEVAVYAFVPSYRPGRLFIVRFRSTERLGEKAFEERLDDVLSLIQLAPTSLEPLDR